MSSGWHYWHETQWESEGEDFPWENWQNYSAHRKCLLENEYWVCTNYNPVNSDIIIRKCQYPTAICRWGKTTKAIKECAYRFYGKLVRWPTTIHRPDTAGIPLRLSGSLPRMCRWHDLQTGGQLRSRYLCPDYPVRRDIHDLLRTKNKQTKNKRNGETIIL